MPSNSPWRRATLVVGALGAAGCHAFVLHEEPVTPEPAPVTRVDVVGAESTYVLRAEGYALLSRDRRLLWTHTTLDDAAHRYVALLGARPPAVAVRVDSTLVATGGTWEGLPLVAVRATPPDPERVMPGEEPARALPQVAARVAHAWVRALALPERAWWFEIGALRLVADPDARLDVVRQAAGAGDRTSLGALLAAPRPVGDDALAAAQAAALLLYLRDRDPTFVAELPSRLRAGGTLPELLARSGSLPHTADAFDDAWRRWLKARAAGRAPQRQDAVRAG